MSKFDSTIPDKHGLCSICQMNWNYHSGEMMNATHDFSPPLTNDQPTEEQQWRRSKDDHGNLVWVKQTLAEELRMDFTLVAGYINSLESQLADHNARLADQRSKDGSALITAERQRQVEKEGWTSDHDREHIELELARAAVAYAMPPSWRAENDIANLLFGRTTRNGTRFFGVWPEEWTFKPSHDDRVRELVKAGALIAAEIDRLTEGGTES